MSSSSFTRLVTVRTTGSTNDDLRAALSGPDGRVDPAAASTWPHLSVLRAQTQTAGHGRAGRTWATPPDGALTASVVLRPLVPAGRLDWLPLLAGLAVQRALAPRLEAAGWRARTKWPNDVVALPQDQPAGPPADPRPAEPPGWGRSRKVAGVLCGLVPGCTEDGPGDDDGAGRGGARGYREDRRAARDAVPAVIVGVGVNLAQGADDLPVPWAASLTGLGVAPALAAPEGVLEDLGQHLADLVARWEGRGGDPDAGDGALGRHLREACSTLGQDVVVAVPSGRVRGRAVDLRPGLVLRDAAGGPAEDGAGSAGSAGSADELVVSAGDVVSARLRDGWASRS
ncbi:biotin--[acetyl-CoA-carboxylase] ligase [Actinomyces israelii]